MHYFPGGKEDMAEQVLAHLDRQLAANLFEPLRSARTPARKLGAMLDTIDAFDEVVGRPVCSSGYAPAWTARVFDARFGGPSRSGWKPSKPSASKPVFPKPWRGHEPKISLFASKVRSSSVPAQTTMACLRARSGTCAPQCSRRRRRST